MKNYGVPYMGSKNFIATEIVANLPPARRFYDLFAGGCAITHSAMESGKYQEFYCNDIDFRGVTLFRDAIAGKYKDERRVITREEFNRLKDTDPYVALCWSFGNRADTYLWGADKEKSMQAILHMAFAQTPTEAMYWWRKISASLVERPELLQYYFGDVNDIKSSYPSEVAKLERLNRMIGLSTPIITIGNYYDVNILPDSIIYCDPPYKGTGSYDMNDRTGGFDHDRFYDWLRSTPFPVYVSEYSMPEDFVSIWQGKKYCKFSTHNNSKVVIEHLYLHKRWIDQHPQQPQQPQQLTLF